MAKTKILFLSDIDDKINEIDKLLGRNTYDLYFENNEDDCLKFLVEEAPEIIIIDNDISNIDLRFLPKKITSARDGIIVIIISKDDNIPQEILRWADAFLVGDISSKLLISTINSSLRNKLSYNLLAETNKNNTKSLYTLKVLYNISSEFAGTLEKDKLIELMMEGINRSLEFDLCYVLTFNNDNQPVLIIHSKYTISDELFASLKDHACINYNNLFKNKKIPFELNMDNLICEKHIKSNIDCHTFSIYRYDNMFSQISSGDNFFGLVEIYKENGFTSTDVEIFRTIIQQVSMPLKNASLYQEIKETNKKLKKLEKIKSEFISIVSHELRTPLTVIKGMIDNIKRFFTLPEKMVPAVDTISRNIKRLSGIINDLLDISKIEAGKMDYKFAVTTIDDTIKAVQSTLQGLANDKNIKLLTDIQDKDVKVFVDIDRVDQILVNLVNNAIKFTPNDKTITIRAYVKDSSEIVDKNFEDILKNLSGKYLVVCVHDEGVGIAKENLKHVFDRFEQIENSLTREAGGTGLGLSIARQLLDAHNGAIWCSSELEKGSDFYFALPVSTEKSNFLISHKQRVNQAKVHNDKFASIVISARSEVIENLLEENNLIHKNYLNNSLKETDGENTVLTLVIPDADRNFAKLFKQKIDDTMVNNKARYPKCDIMYSYTIYPEGIN
ncbi:HAMP domain-containing histidine kinase [bacterium]|nr:HAMP domain-containing histidine kinase [bacterium]